MSFFYRLLPEKQVHSECFALWSMPSHKWGKKMAIFMVIFLFLGMMGVVKPTLRLLMSIIQHPSMNSRAEVRVLDNDAYHADRSAVSSSALKAMLRSPAHYQAGLLAPRKETPAMVFGTAFHAALLEPDLFAESYFVFDGDRRGKAYADALAANPGKRDLKPDEMANIEGMAAAVGAFSNGVLLDALKIAEREVSIFYEDKDSGVSCKIRPDFLVRSAGIFDLKTTDDARPQSFLRSAVADYSYDLSAVMYGEGVDALTGKNLPFYIVAVEKVAPYGVWVYEIRRALEDSLYRNGWIKLRKALRLYRQCSETNDWPCYQDSFSHSGFSIPGWMRETDPAVEAELQLKVAA